MFFTQLYRHHGNNLQRKERTARIRQFERLFNVKAKVIATREPRQLLKKWVQQNAQGEATNYVPWRTGWVSLYVVLDDTLESILFPPQNAANYPTPYQIFTANLERSYTVNLAQFFANKAEFSQQIDVRAPAYQQLAPNPTQFHALDWLVALESKGCATNVSSPTNSASSANSLTTAHGNAAAHTSANSNTTSARPDESADSDAADLLLVRVPVREAADVFCYFFMGGFNDCPEPAVQTAVARYWWQRYRAVPFVLSSDTVEFMVGAPPTSVEDACDLALEQYIFCPDLVEQCMPDGDVNTLAAYLYNNSNWYFWWD